MINSMSCLGYRGFSTKETLNLAIPNGKPGSGLTILVGPNGGGKSTLVECFYQLSLAKAYNNSVSFSRGKRNFKAGDIVEISINFDGASGVLSTRNGGSQAQWSGQQLPDIYYLPSRRFFNPFFSMMPWDRETYLRNQRSNQFRSSSLDQYTSRLIDLNSKGPRQFNEVLGRILGEQIEWTIDQDDNAQYLVKITKKNGLSHNSDGLGEGVLSLMFIVDPLCGEDNQTVVIDEPEMSLHPQLQMRLLREILERTRKSQVVISTHSPNMISLEAIANGAMVARVFDDGDGSKICPIDEPSRQFVASTIGDICNPHILGLDARSCFFAEDGIIITEGQEDVVLYPVILKGLHKNYSIPFFGFGAGGASSIRKVAHLLSHLGFKRIGAIFDGDKEEEYKKFNEEFSQAGYKAWMIPADDIRCKKAIPEKPPVDGLLAEDRKTLKDEYVGKMSMILDEINDFLE